MFRKNLKVVLITILVFYANVIIDYCARITIGVGANMTLSGSPTVTTIDLTVSLAAGLLGVGILSADAATLNVNGNWSNQGTFTAATNAVNFIGESGVSQTLNFGGTGTGKFFYNLTRSGVGTL